MHNMQVFKRIIFLVRACDLAYLFRYNVKKILEAIKKSVILLKVQGNELCENVGNEENKYFKNQGDPLRTLQYFIFKLIHNG